MSEPAGLPAEAGGQGLLVRRGAYLVGQEDFGQVAELRAVDQAESALGSETADSVASGRLGQAKAAGEPNNPEAKLALAFEAAVPQEKGLDDALGDIEAEARDDVLIGLFPEECGIGFVVFHGWILKSWQSRIDGSKQRKKAKG